MSEATRTSRRESRNWHCLRIMGRRFVTSRVLHARVGLDDDPLAASHLDAHGVAEDVPAVLVLVDPDSDVLAGVVSVSDPAAAAGATATHRGEGTMSLPVPAGPRGDRGSAGRPVPSDSGPWPPVLLDSRRLRPYLMDRWGHPKGLVEEGAELRSVRAIGRR